ncbi:MAG: hypothetical protein LBH76_05040 [Propionibacteriaceae bacterium]|jgi:hypothetical protein|nr:hypothetical protein [Propionibacteriaceae bacterium]
MTDPTPSSAPQWRTYPGEAGEAADWPMASALEPAAAEIAPTAVGGVPTAYTLPGYSRDDPLEIGGGMSETRKEGVWTVPPYLRVGGGLGSITLDFQRATVAAPVIDVEMVGGWGAVTMILPQGWAARLDRLRPGWGTRRSQVLEEPAAGQPLLALRGVMDFGALYIRYPNRGDRRSLERQLKKERRTLR